MAIMRQRQIDEFSDRTGIRAADGKQAEALDALSRAAFNLIKIVELERSGIRDGDGYWSGSDPLDHLVDDLPQQLDQYRSSLAE